jgi:tryptophan-rich sensory protein
MTEKIAQKVHEAVDATKQSAEHVGETMKDTLTGKPVSHTWLGAIEKRFVSFLNMPPAIFVSGPLFLGLTVWMWCRSVADRSVWLAHLRRVPNRISGYLYDFLWAVSFLSMSFGAYDIWRKGPVQNWTYLLSYEISVVFILLAPVLLFALERIEPAFAMGIAGLASIITTMVLFGRVSLSASLSLLPTAGMLCYTVAMAGLLWYKNRDRIGIKPSGIRAAPGKEEVAEAKKIR